MHTSADALTHWRFWRNEKPSRAAASEREARRVYTSMRCVAGCSSLCKTVRQKKYVTQNTVLRKKFKKKEKEKSKLTKSSEEMKSK